MIINAKYCGNALPSVTADQGDVEVDGPDGIDVWLTPEAAAETSDRLLAGATQAMGQRLEAARFAQERRDNGRIV
ncbi:MAG: hypothetical protein EON59_08100 [Alphaproteobacteria bacterium]|nr:MAG: hypothetical protein EON59_08100 [Alphaproteobacteria bacterium]